MGGGEYPFNNKREVYSYVTPVKLESRGYLKHYIEHHGLNRWVRLGREHLYFLKNNYVDSFLSNYYLHGRKLLTTRLQPSCVTIQAVYLWLNIFGTRVMDGLSVATTVSPEYIPTMIYCVEFYLDGPITASQGSVKVRDLKQLYLKLVNKGTITDTAKFIHYLSRKEQAEIMNNRKGGVLNC